ncbi:DUF4440 domain-containing protein [Nocardioides seonyuensis]|uniref:DUF4440 domain-containing protein n=1 Tax=Nocardioides seonyuensis TaxID=2518371 RepID=A0A4P7IJ54_9ACTN|nr:nuclear transport factor 2 family protein [Nocardioides seonyuensis]QBX55911.1 DUF4440 domain-containing protein [Nocardioides seonyuensis]
MSDPGTVATEFLLRWTDSFCSGDSDALVDLYTDAALFFGSAPDLKRGMEGVRSYFTDLPSLHEPHVDFEVLASEAPTPGTVTCASMLTFRWTGHAGTRVRLTHALVEEDGDWRCVLHHATTM